MNDDEVLGLFDSLSNWGRWGPDDTIGTANFITPEVRVRAASLVREGRSVSLSRPIDPGIVDPISQPRRYMVMTGEGLQDEHRIEHVYGEGSHPRWNPAIEYIGLVYHGGLTTHIDALSHMFWDGKMYNGIAAETVNATTGATAGAITDLPNGILSRGLFYDIPGVRGVDWLEPGEGVTPEDLEAAEEQLGIRAEEGDVAFLYTGVSRREKIHGKAALMEGRWCGPQAGWASSCLPWLHERRVAAIGHDSGQDQIPSGHEGVELGVPIHVIGLVAMGLWLIDNCALDGLADTCRELGRYEFQFSIAPLQLMGCTGSPANPIATF